MMMFRGSSSTEVIPPVVSYSAGGPGDTGPPDGGGGPAGSGGNDDPFASRPSTPQPRMPVGPGRVLGSGGVETPPELGGSPGTVARRGGKATCWESSPLHQDAVRPPEERQLTNLSFNAVMSRATGGLRRILRGT